MKKKQTPPTPVAREGDDVLLAEVFSGRAAEVIRDLERRMQETDRMSIEYGELLLAHQHLRAVVDREQARVAQLQKADSEQRTARSRGGVMGGRKGAQTKKNTALKWMNKIRAEVKAEILANPARTDLSIAKEFATKAPRSVATIRKFVSSVRSSSDKT